jgi:DNA polymerase elongation subunit (family B)
MEMGASVTATGRQITTHMMGTIGELLTGKYSVLNTYTETKYVKGFPTVSKFYETEEDSPVIYGDTDSAYFLTYASNKEEAVEIADTIADGVNSSFPNFMISSFNCQAPDFHDLIKAGREIVGIRGLFQAKKKYMIKVVDIEGVATDKLKSMGSEIKKADTPKPIQKFLKATVDLILDGKDFTEVEKFVNGQRKKLFSRDKYHDIIQLGVARAANNFEKQYQDYKNIELKGKGKVRLPGHIRAACIYNELAIKEEGQGARLIQAGDKVKVFYLKNNPYSFKSIAFPADIVKFPKWFDENFKVDVPLTEEKMIDAKLDGIFSAWGYEVPTVQGEFIKTIIEF